MRHSRTFDAVLESGQAISLTVTEDEGRAVKLEGSMGKIGSPLDAVIRCICKSITLALQRGVNAAAYARTLNGRTGDEGSEAMGWIARTLGEHYSGATENHAGPAAVQD